MPRDILDFNTGLPDNYVFVVQSPSFNFDGKYNDGQTLLLILDGKAHMADGSVEDRREWFSTGNGWTNRENGQIAVHESGDPEQRFQQSCDVAKFVKRLAELGLGQRLRDGVGDGRGYYNAQTFAGLAFRMKQEESVNPVSGDKRTRAMPTEIVQAGTAAVAPAPVYAASPAPQAAGMPVTAAPVAPTAPAPVVPVPQAAAPQPIPGVGVPVDNGGNDPVRAQLVALAAATKGRGGTHQEFVAQATQVAGWDRYAEELTSPDTGIFAQA